MTAPTLPPFEGQRRIGRFDPVRFRLWARVAIVLVGLALVPLLLVSGLAYRISNDGADEMRDEALRSEAHLEAEVLARWIADLTPLVESLPSLVRLDERSPESRAAFTRLVARLLPQVTEVALVDASGAPVVPTVLVGPDDAERPPLLEPALRDDLLADPSGVRMGRAWPGRRGRGASFPLAVVVNPTAPPGERWILALRVAFDPDVGLSHREDHDLLVVDADGRLLLGAPKRPIDPRRLAPLLGNDAVFKMEGGIRGVLVPVGGTPWSVVITDDADEVPASAARIRDTLPPLLAAVVTSAMALAVIFAGSLSGPVERLRDAVLAVAEGRTGVRATEDTVRRSDEIGDLARAFDHMAARLEANRAKIERQQGEIESFNRELQDRVDARTRELKDAQEGLVRSGQLAAVAEIGAGLAHELNNPLAAVLGLAQVLKARYPDEGLLADLEAQADRCREVVETLRRIQTLEVDPGDAPIVPLGDVLHQVEQLVAGSYQRRGVSLSLVAPPAEAKVRIDPAHASRILVLVLNALAAGLESGARVSISGVARGDREVELRITPDRALASDLDRRDEHLASAHGLWVARQLLERLGGKLEAEAPGANVPAGNGSVAPRSGVEWSVTLPGPARGPGGGGALS